MNQVLPPYIQSTSMKSRKRYADTSESSERKDTDTEDETIPRTQVRKPRSKRKKEKCMKEE